MKKHVSILMIVLLTLFAACSSDDDDKTVYTVTFETDGGSPVPSVQMVEEGSMATAPSTNPAKAGYAFVFWHLSGVTTAYNYQTPVKGDITLYAKWQEEATAEYWQVTWNLNGGTWPSDDNHATQVLKEGTLAEPAVPTKAGDTFEGWYKESALTNKVAFPYDVSNLTADFTLYAKWETKEEPGNKGVAMVASVGYGHFVLNADGTLLALGRNVDGQLGTGNTTDVDTPTQVATGVSAVYAGMNAAFIVKADGSLLGTGLNTAGQLGLGDETNRSNFTAIPVNDVKEVVAGTYHTLMLKKNGSLWVSGSNYYGQLGVGDDTNRKSFVATNLTSNVISASAGYGYSVVLKEDGTVWGTGDGSMGALGETVTSSLNKSFVQIFSGAKAVAAGSEHTLILKEDGTVYSSGFNDSGQLGTGMSTGNGEYATSFTQAIDDSGAPLTGVTAIAAGYDFSLAVKTDGTLWSAGRTGNKFQLYSSDAKVKSMSAGRLHFIVVRNDGTSRTYGRVNPFGGLGGNATIHVKVQDYNQFQYISELILLDYNGDNELFRSNNHILTGSSGKEISVKPGIYNISLKASNLTVPFYFRDVEVSDNETVTILYEWVSFSVGYKWTLTRSN